ncbi:MAG: hypothetical protein PHQ19_07785 [Candidatus Krumholzibacteria bacterium]|nr:hypothetical protein [Candidatus Krumholzibacteria bacterium]
MSQRSRIGISLLAVCAAGALSCADRDPGAAARAEFDSLAAGALGLYRHLHPLRWSSLGLEGGDSLLFAFTDDEMTAAAARLDSLLGALSSLPAASLDRRRLDDSFLLLDWIKGERFALGPDGACRNNPLLYCWMIEEALFQIPSRPAPPYPGEREQYARRLAALPALAGSAARLLEAPGAPLLEEAVVRLDRIAATIPALASEARRRYGEPVPGCAAAAGPVEALRAAFSGMLGGRPRGMTIMGLENLSLVLKYAEHLDADPAALIAEAESALQRIGRRPHPAGARRTAAAGPPADPDSILSAIETAIAARRLAGAGGGRSPVIAARPLYTPLRIPVDPFLTVPVTERRRARAEFAGPPAGECATVCIVPAQPAADGDRLFYDLLLCCSAVTAPARDACRAGTTIRAVFSSETFRRGWETVVLQEIAPLFPERREAVARIEGEQRILDLARMIVALRLHAGIYTAEAARAYLAETTGLPPALLDGEVASASASPAAAFDGIAALLIERLRKTPAGQGGAGGRLGDLLLENGMLPLALIEKKLPS